MSDQSEKPNKNVVFYGKMLTFSRVKLETNDVDIIKKQLAIVSPTKDSQIPIVIESTVPQKLEELLTLFWDWGLQPIGVVKGLLDQQAKELKIALFPGDGKRIQRIKPITKNIIDTDNTNPANVEKNKDGVSKDNINNQDRSDAVLAVTVDKLETPKAKDFVGEIAEKNDKIEYEKSYLIAENHAVKNTITASDFGESIDSITSLVYEKMLRSGQSVNHVGGDLILTSSVNNGSEAITENNLHIYGKGLGRLVAGATGDKDAHIFCQQFNPTLVSVAGTYCLRDNIPEEYIDKPVHVSYAEDKGLIYRIMNH